MPAYETRILSESDYPHWDCLVRQSPQGTIFHSSPWITTAAKLLLIRPVLIGVFSNTRLIGGCNLFLETPLPFYTRGTTEIPLTPYGGIIFENPRSSHVRPGESREHQIIDKILEKIQALNCGNVTLTNGPGLVDVRPFVRRGWKERVLYTYIVSLRQDIFSHISHDARNRIRKAQKMGITVTKEYNPEIYWKLLRATYEKQRLDVPVKKEYLFALMDMLSRHNLGEMYLAKTPSGDAVSATFNAYDSRMAHGWEGANDPAFRNTGATSLLVYEVFTDLRERGFSQFNMMGANIPHLAHFYASFDPTLVPYYSVRYGRGISRMKGVIRSLLKK